jgi:hypothetical protein
LGYWIGDAHKKAAATGQTKTRIMKSNLDGVPIVATFLRSVDSCVYSLLKNTPFAEISNAVVAIQPSQCTMRVGHNPRWGWIITALSTQGSSFLATLGCGRNPVGIEP